MRERDRPEREGKRASSPIFRAFAQAAKPKAISPSLFVILQAGLQTESELSASNLDTLIMEIKTSLPKAHILKEESMQGMCKRCNKLGSGDYGLTVYGRITFEWQDSGYGPSGHYTKTTTHYDFTDGARQEFICDECVISWKRKHLKDGLETVLGALVIVALAVLSMYWWRNMPNIVAGILALTSLGCFVVMIIFIQDICIGLQSTAKTRDQFVIEIRQNDEDEILKHSDQKGRYFTRKEMNKLKPNTLW